MESVLDGRNGLILYFNLSLNYSLNYSFKLNHPPYLMPLSLVTLLFLSCCLLTTHVIIRLYPDFSSFSFLLLFLRLFDLSEMVTDAYLYDEFLKYLRAGFCPENLLCIRKGDVTSSHTVQIKSIDANRFLICFPHPNLSLCYTNLIPNLSLF